MIESSDLTRVSDRDLGTFIRDLRLKIAACEARIEPPAVTRLRNIKLARGTLLTVGGLLGIAWEPIAAVVFFVGLWDWIDAVAEDASVMNRQLKLRRELAEISFQLAVAEAELRRRSLALFGEDA